MCNSILFPLYYLRLSTNIHRKKGFSNDIAYEHFQSFPLTSGHVILGERRKIYLSHMRA